MNAAPQLSLFDQQTKTDRDFAAFHAANPEVLETLIALAQEAKAAGLQHIGIRCLWETMRYRMTVVVRRPLGEFVLNDHLTSRYSRLVCQRRPDLAPMFQLRRLRS